MPGLHELESRALLALKLSGVAVAFSSSSCVPVVSAVGKAATLSVVPLCSGPTAPECGASSVTLSDSGVALVTSET